MNRGLSAYSAQSEDEEQHSSMHKARASLQSEELGIVGAAASNIALVSPPPPPRLMPVVCVLCKKKSQIDKKLGDLQAKTTLSGKKSSLIANMVCVKQSTATQVSPCRKGGVWEGFSRKTKSSSAWLSNEQTSSADRSTLPVSNCVPSPQLAGRSADRRRPAPSSR